MKINMLKRFAALGAVLALTGAGLLVSAAGASAQSPPRTAAITPIFSLNGIFSDGGSARPEISQQHDTLYVNMASLRRPNAAGEVLTPTWIRVTFPDAGTFYGTLEAPGMIRWDNNSAWYKTRYVPNVVGEDLDTATASLRNAGFVVGDLSTFVDRSCRYIGVVGRQSPLGGSTAIPGDSVSLVFGKHPVFPTCPE